MPFLDLVQDRVWAIYQPKLDEINGFIKARLEDQKIEFPESIKNNSGNRADDNYKIINGTGIIPVYGVLNKRMNMIMEFSGGTSTELLKKDIQSALDNPKVKGIVLDIDSPGGSVDGTKELADFIFESRGKKPIIAYANGMMASAAYWIGSAADKIVTYDTSIVGSIGVALTHYDYSEQDKQLGIKRTQIYAGKYKRIASDEKPLSKEGEEYLQNMVDTFYSIFVEDVAKNRGMDVKQVIDDFANGGDYVGRQALDTGLVDYIGGMNLAVTITKKQGEINMDIQTLKSEHKTLYQEVFDLGAASIDTAKIESEAMDVGEQTGIEKERTRVTSILSADADMETAIEAVKDGISAEGAYKMFFEAEKEKKAKGLKEMQDASTESLGQEIDDTYTSADAGKTASEKLNAKALEIMEGSDIGYLEALKKAKKDNPDLVSSFRVEAVERADKR